MKKRPTIALSCIFKNEAKNIGPFFKSISGCFDEIHITDTGSTDNTVELLQLDSLKELAGCPVYIHHFEWIKDFSAARNYAFSKVPKEIDYIMWMDGDDVLSDKEAFKHWRDHTMHCAHQWMVNYNYAYSGDKPVCTFIRERIVKNNHGFEWKFFLHEGLIQTSNRKTDTQFIPSFTINHMRKEEDTKNHKSRNLGVFEHHIANGVELEPRMIYYYGKELFDAAKYLEAAKYLGKAATLPANSGLENHDRLMANQFLSMALGMCGKWEESLSVALNSLQLAPDRSEYWICVADAMLKLGNFSACKLFYEGSKHCFGGTSGGAVYTSPEASGVYPYLQLAKIYLSETNVDAAQIEVNHLLKINNPEAKELQHQIDMIRKLSKIPKKEELQAVDDIVITCPPACLITDWDETVLENKGLGGSETAAVEIARLLKKKTNRPVKIFSKRKTADIMPSGVEYLPLDQLEDYFKNYFPYRHIAWRHASKLTEAPTFVWSHDLVTMGSQYENNYDKLWCLTEFHKNFVMDLQGVSEHKIDLVENGIDPSLFNENIEKKPYKVIFSSSPDRGWERCIEICKRARKNIPELELHLFYGTENMRKSGMHEQAEKLDRLVRENDFVHYHGFVSKKDLVRHFKESACWLYPADFIETSCITAMEAVCSGAYPLVRNMGALKYTLADCISKNQCTVLDHDACDDETYNIWAERLEYVLVNKLWKGVDVDKNYYSWENRLDKYIQSMNI